MISKKPLLLFQNVGAWPLCSLPLISRPCLLIYIIFIFLYKYNYKIDHKSKSKGNYRKLNIKRKNQRRAKRYKKLFMELRVHILPSLEVKR